MTPPRDLWLTCRYVAFIRDVRAPKREREARHGETPADCIEHAHLWSRDKDVFCTSLNLSSVNV